MSYHPKNSPLLLKSKNTWLVLINNYTSLEHLLSTQKTKQTKEDQTLVKNKSPIWIWLANPIFKKWSDNQTKKFPTNSFRMLYKSSAVLELLWAHDWFLKFYALLRWKSFKIKPQITHLMKFYIFKLLFLLKSKLF